MEKRVKRRILQTPKDKPKPESKLKKLKAPTPKTDTGREQLLTNLAMSLAERQIRDGTASAQVITHFLKMGSTAQKLEHEKLKNENVLLQAKTESLRSQADLKEMYLAAVKAMSQYSGNPQIPAPEEEDEND